jgi:hypothetical protein
MGQDKSIFLYIRLALSISATVQAQSNQASISGVVADEQGAVIPSAKILLRAGPDSTRFRICRSGNIQCPQRSPVSGAPSARE